MIDIFVKHEFLNDLDAQSDFEKILSQKSWSSRTILAILSEKYRENCTALKRHLGHFH